MVEIHESFNLPGARFVFSALGEKFPPLEKAWKTGLDHNHSFEEALKYIGNVGIMPVDHTLVKLSDNTKETIGFDLDNPASFESLIPKLPKTLTWETRPGRKAMIFKCKDKAARVKFGAKPDLAQFKLFDSHQVVTKLVAGKEHEVYRAVGEIKLERTYQIVPPSWKEVDGQRVDYILLDSAEPNEISLEWLLKQLAEIGIHTSEKINLGSRYARAALRKECEILEATSEGSRNTQLNKSAYVIGQIIGAGQLAENVAHDALYKVAIQIGLEPDEIERTLRSGLEAGKLEPREIKKSPDLREICITNRHLHEISGDAVQAIADAQEEDPRVYVRGAQLVRIKSDEDNNYKVGIIGDSELKGLMSRSANFVKERNAGPDQGTTLVPADPTDACVRDALYSMTAASWPFPPLKGFVESPVLREDGSIITVPGYDTKSGIYYSTNGLKLKLLRLGKSEAVEAAKFLMSEFLGDFPWKDKADGANALAALIQPVLRPTIKGNIPFYLIDKPEAGSGASKLATVIAIVNTGRYPAMAGKPHSDEEMRKFITAILLRSPSLIVLDNVEGSLGYPSLSRCLTSDIWNDRILGKSEDTALPQRACWMGTGNNISPSGDMRRRIFKTRLDAKVAQPWLRTDFKHPNLESWTFEHRSEILSAILVMCCSWFEAGKPKPTIKPIGSYEHWTETLGGVLEFAGVEGFLGNSQEFYDNADQEEASLSEFFSAWYLIYGDKPQKVIDIHDALVQPTTDPYLKAFQKAMPEKLARAIGKSYRSSQPLAYFLTTKRDKRFVNGLMLTSEAIDHKRHLSGWKVEKIDLQRDKDVTKQDLNNSGQNDNAEATRQNTNMQGFRRGGRAAENTLKRLEVEDNNADSLLGTIKFGDSPASARSVDSESMASSLADNGHIKYIEPNNEEKKGEDCGNLDGLDTGPRIGKIDRPTPESKKPRWTEEEEPPSKPCGSCDVAVKGDKTAIKCEDCSFLRKETEADTLEVYFLKDQVEPWQGINIPRRVLHEAGTTAVLLIAEARELIQAGIALIATEEI